MFSLRIFVLLPALIPFACPEAAAFSEVAHPISVTETQIYVTRNSARMRIKLFAEDLYLFQELQPDNADTIPAKELKRGLEDHRRFLLDKVTLRDTKGEPYKGTVTDVQPFEIPEAGIAVEDLMLHTATYEIEFRFPEPPEFLTIQQDISDENFIFPSEMKLVLHQAGTELTFTENLKPGAAETIRFDWSNDQPTEEASEKDWDAWFEKQREETLGITSYSSVYSFIYVEPGEVRHEVLIPLASLKTFLPFEHKDSAFVDVDEQQGVRAVIENWLTDKNPVQINGVDISPDFTRIDFYGLDLKDFAKQAEQRRVSLANGRVGIIMTYPTADDAVRTVQLQWNVFNSSMRKIQSVVFAYPDAMQKFEFSRFNTPEENTFAWETAAAELPKPVTTVAVNMPPRPKLVLPLASLMLTLVALIALAIPSIRKTRLPMFVAITAAAALPVAQKAIPHPWQADPEIAGTAATEVFQQLHTGTYRALDFGTQERIYEALAKSVDGQLLESLYLQLRESLEMREQGGAVARVRELSYSEGGKLPESTSDSVRWPGFQYRSQWTVSGTVEHWGHIHERQNQFDAVFTVQELDGEWKITDMMVQDQKNLVTSTRLRRF